MGSPLQLLSSTHACVGSWRWYCLQQSFPELTVVIHIVPANGVVRFSCWASPDFNCEDNGTHRRKDAFQLFHRIVLLQLQLLNQVGARGQIIARLTVLHEAAEATSVSFAHGSQVLENTPVKMIRHAVRSWRSYLLRFSSCNSEVCDGSLIVMSGPLSLLDFHHNGRQMLAVKMSAHVCGPWVIRQFCPARLADDNPLSSGIVCWAIVVLSNLSSMAS